MNRNNAYAMSPLNPKKTSYNCARMDSCLSEPSAQLLADTLDAGDLRAFVEVLNRETDTDGNVLNVNEELEDRDAATVLHLAVSSAGKSDFVSALLRHKEANPNVANRVTKKFPLHVAAERAEVEVVKMLLAAGADVNAKMENGSTALHLVAVRYACMRLERTSRRLKYHSTDNSVFLVHYLSRPA